MSSTQTITCPFCAEEIKETAIKCRYCGEYLVDPAEVPPVQPPRRGTGDLSQRVPTAGPVRGSGRLRQPAFPPSPLPDWATKRNLLVGGGVVTVIGLLVAPKFTLLFLALGVPSLWVLFDSTWRYEKPSWAEAALGPIVLPLLYYLVKRTFTKPEIVRPTVKRPDGLPNVAYPPGRQLLATLSMLVLLIGLMSRGASERPQVARQEAVEPVKVQAPVRKVPSSAPIVPVAKAKPAAPMAYTSFNRLITQYKGMTTLQQENWGRDHEWEYWVQGRGTVSEVKERDIFDEIDGDYFVVVAEIGDEYRAVIFYPKTPENERLVSGLSKGSRIDFRGNLKTIKDWEFWATGYVRSE